MTASDPGANVRRSAYLLLTAVAVAVAAAKVVGAENVWEPSRFKPPAAGSYGADRPAPPDRVWPKDRPDPTPMFGSNDRSRWATIRALVDGGTYVVGRRANFRDPTGPWDDRGVIFEDGYQSLDKVMNPDTGEFLSSKPPLLSTLLAGEYWGLKTAFGWSLDRDRWWVVAVILLTVNVLPFGVYLVLLGRLVEDYGATDFGRLWAFAVAALGTFLVTFAGTLNNHTPAAYCVLFAVYPLLRKGGRPAEESPGKLAATGFFAGLAAALDLPAAAILGGLFVPLLVVRPGRALGWFLPAALIPVAALLVCNYAALGRLLPAYSEFGGPWYNYPGSHWSKLGTPAAKGIDFAAEPKWLYAFHLLAGHHGWFLLTPAWLVGAAGLGGLAWAAGPQVADLVTKRKAGRGGVWTLPLFGLVALAVSAVVVGFYVRQTNNYGGNTSGPRWLFWLTPLWVVGALPAADRVGRSAAGRVVAAGLLTLSVVSAFYPAWNPWRPPWVQQLLEVTDRVRY